MTEAPPVTAGLLQPFAYGAGYQELVLGTSPGANTNFSLGIAGTAVSRLVGAVVTVTADANVANRWLELDFADSDGTIWTRNGAGVFVTASSVVNFDFDIGRGANDWRNSGADYTPVFCMLANRYLLPTQRVQLNLGNKQAGDTLTGIRLTFERFPTGARGFELGRVPE
jgi:hypothetical protein